MDLTNVVWVDAPELIVEQEIELCARERLERLESAILAEEQIEIPVRHYFIGPGVYAREITIPAGATVTGKIHKHAHLNIISGGDITVFTEHGTRRIQAPHTMQSPPGTKRAGYAHTDTVWTTVHCSRETDLEKLEADLIAPSHDAYLAFVEQQQIKG